MIRRLASFAFAASLVVTAATAPRAAHAEAPSVPAEVRDLLREKGPIRTNLTPDGKTERYGRASILIGTPFERIKKVITNYAGYKDLVPEKFSDCHVVAVEKGQTDLHMRIPMKSPLLKGIDVWQIVRFGSVKEVSKDVFQLEGTFVKGSNIKDSNIVFTYRKVTPTVTQLTVDLLTLPTIPATQTMIDEEQRDAAADVVLGVRKKAQGHELPVTEL